MMLIASERTNEDTDALAHWLDSEAELRRPANIEQCDMLHRIADMLRPRTPDQIAAEAFQRAAERSRCGQ